MWYTETGSSKKIVFAVCILMACLSICSVVLLEVSRDAALHERVYYSADSSVSRIQYVLNSLFLKTKPLEIMVVQSEGRITHFEYIAETMCDDPSIRSIQLAPNGVVTMVYPLEGNMAGKHDLFADPQRATEAVYARDSGQMTLSGPFVLRQGGFGLVARRPIYLKNSTGEKTFWGFSIVVLDLPAAFAPVQLHKLVEEGFSYKLHRVHPDSGQVQIIHESSSAPLRHPVHISFDMPNAVWTLSVAPTAGWRNKGLLLLEIMLALLITSLVTLLVHNYLFLKKQKEALYRLSLTDPLTSLANFRAMRAQLRLWEEQQQPFLFFYFDFDGFKKINDSYGHYFGDEFLIRVASRLMTFCAEEQALVYRIGGDEFALLVACSNEQPCVQDFHDRLKVLFAAPFVIGEESIQASISIGCARYPLDTSDLERLITLADTRMYSEKKERPGGRTVFGCPE